MIYEAVFAFEVACFCVLFYSSVQNGIKLNRIDTLVSSQLSTLFFCIAAVSVGMVFCSFSHHYQVFEAISSNQGILRLAMYLILTFASINVSMSFRRL